MTVSLQSGVDLGPPRAPRLCYIVNSGYAVLPDPDVIGLDKGQKLFAHFVLCSKLKKVDVECGLCVLVL